MLDGIVTDIKEAKSFGYRVQHNDIFSCRSVVTNVPCSSVTDVV